MTLSCNFGQVLVNWTNAASCHVAQALQSGSINSTLLLAEDCANQACVDLLSALAIQNQPTCTLWDNVTSTPWPLAHLNSTICLPKILPVSNGRVHIHVGVSVGSGLTGIQIALIVGGVILGICILICICQACQATPAEENNFEALPVTPVTELPVPAPQQAGEVWVVYTQVYVDDVTRNNGNGGSVQRM
ncbi:unnamed protein product [Aphanomyces euteiches]|uniref:Uncharacterized protein n=1 Tax=Aphanomyces euteiches TaxID=100861 RepID=A0A6G0WAF5_9STRA|nr:hypothetical protein Ae201684_017583 [Aphanomyces euteiches]KAH9076003.1 hypothetical protein Ae201684P_012493 [Aphanomyces euteiches]KAH9151182.1 hypothetical protein AeRB84_006156 [Aphanomyces euteiches]KAH9151761.1 hypothetical protein AeRB84_005705 [Aphanomyces euteiches]KAH9152177.1 hypothetical protein AeRB84_005346 [Aphanomyces euteiches]